MRCSYSDTFELAKLMRGNVSSMPIHHHVLPYVNIPFNKNPSIFPSKLLCKNRNWREGAIKEDIEMYWVC